MNTLNRYIGLEVIKGAAFAALVLLALLNFFTFADELRDLGEGNYGLGSILLYLTLTSPHSLYELIPSGALIGGLVVLGNMANNHELVAMQAAGVSRGRIVWAVLRAGIVISLISVVISEYVIPPAERAAQMLKATATRQQVASQTRYGIWIRDGNVYVNIRQIENQEHLGDIHIFEISPDGRPALAMHAARANFDRGIWKLEDIGLTHFDAAGNAAIAEHKAQEDWSSVLSPDMLDVFIVRPENLSAQDLAKYMAYQTENAQKSLAVEQAFWGRMVNPFITLAMLLVAIPFVLNVRRDISSGQRIVVGVTIGLGFYLTNRLVSHLGLVYELNAPLTMVTPPLVVLLAALVAFRRRP
ncbi:MULTISPECIES: LPS export ABC transporter permease LptG [Methylococcus]|uniref:LPS export ABC transporter permease LptG n=1 Tax=Methylococcus capsulatus TaxID=414 RepID=A0ABZ2F621_METCP|nr:MULTISPECIES: LPS export ABC transporter permease LptG [Methylococcus]MDF9392500.1 LPS export ABC transporter permease LptG [Methylococcus capsulatus]